MRLKSPIVAGIDIGASTAQAVILNESKIIFSHVIPNRKSVIRNRQPHIQYCSANKR